MREGQSSREGQVPPGEEDAPFEFDEPPEPELCSHSRMDASLQRKLMDNIDKYTCEAVAEVKQTHRFRGKYSTDSIISTY
jgi:general transcription factor 3C polypeptide 5 (transcription factor C subunit 1)